MTFKLGQAFQRLLATSAGFEPATDGLEIRELATGNQSLRGVPNFLRLGNGQYFSDETPTLKGTDMNRPTVFAGNGGWWARLDGNGTFMERGPYPFKWMAQLAFPIQRWTFK